jgi:hypothetical protein
MARNTPAPIADIAAAVRAYCLWCCGNDKKEVELCPCNGTNGASDCNFHLLRFRENPQCIDYPEEVRRRCRDCLISQVEIDRRSSVGCPLWSHRPRSERSKTTLRIPAKTGGVREDGISRCSDLPSGGVEGQV